MVPSFAKATDGRSEPIYFFEIIGTANAKAFFAFQTINIIHELIIIDFTKVSSYQGGLVTLAMA